MNTIESLAAEHDTIWSQVELFKSRLSVIGRGIYSYTLRREIIDELAIWQAKLDDTRAKLNAAKPSWVK